MNLMDKRERDFTWLMIVVNLINRSRANVGAITHGIPRTCFEELCEKRALIVTNHSYKYASDWLIIFVRAARTFAQLLLPAAQPRQMHSGNWKCSNALREQTNGNQHFSRNPLIEQIASLDFSRLIRKTERIVSRWNLRSSLSLSFSPLEKFSNYSVVLPQSFQWQIKFQEKEKVELPVKETTLKREQPRFW